MEALLGAKIGCLFALLVLTLGCGLIPICFKWFRIDAATGRRHQVLSLLGCISAGVFLGAGLMHMSTEALEGIESEIQKFMGQNSTKRKGNSSDAASSTQVEYPYGELLISLGFFLVFFLESFALQCCPGAAGGSTLQEEEWGGGSNGFGFHSHPPLPSPPRGPLRALVLLLSLSFHSVFEGLAVGLQTTIAGTIQLCVAVLAHKGLVVFGVGLRLVKLGTGSRWATFSILALALMSPLGLALGMSVATGDSEGGQGLAQAVLEGVAAGTFLYVTFLEILPRELAGPGAPLTKWCCVAAGFTFMAIIALWA
ncbi:zinc transporter ZIP2 [Thomomys bottae]